MPFNFFLFLSSDAHPRENCFLICSAIPDFSVFTFAYDLCFSSPIFKDWLVSSFYFFPQLYGRFINGIFCHLAPLVRNWIQSGGYKELCYWKTYDIVISTSPLDLFNSYRSHAYCKYIDGVSEACHLPYFRGYIDLNFLFTTN